MRHFVISSFTNFVFLTFIVHYSVGSEQQWEKFKQFYGKIYQNRQIERKRFSIFDTNWKRIQHHNRLYELGQVTYRMEMNSYGDLSPEEFASFVNKHKVNVFTSRTAYKPLKTFSVQRNVELPNSVDWRQKGFVTRVKNQGYCASCWSFSVVGALEGQYKRHSNILLPLSEQSLIDCTTKYGNSGCNGGWMDNAYEYIAQHGIDTEQNYPYTERQNVCNRRNPKDLLRIRGYSTIPQGDEYHLKAALAQIGPISIAMDVTANMQFYADGVFYDTRCNNAYLNHAVLAVGYGTEAGKGDFWIVKNSWGPRWGNNGYVRIARNRNNHCGIASIATFPLLQ